MNAKTLLKAGLLIGLIAFTFNTVAQSPVALATRKAELQALSELLQQRDAADRRQAAQLARGAGLPLRRELRGGGALELQRWRPGQSPQFYLTYNVDAADSVSTDELWPGGSTGLGLTGNGMTAGIWDGGAVYANHDDLLGRVNQVDGVTTLSGHATHVAGTLIGDGGSPFYAAARGMAYDAELDAYDWNGDTAEMAAAAAAGLLVSNHSYGIAAGWIPIGDLPPDNWWWIGGADNYGQDPNFGYYDGEAAYWDEVAFNAPYYLIVKAAGNDRSDFGPSPGEEYTVIDQAGNPLGTDTAPREADCAPLGFDCLPTVSVAKNILTVGAVDDLIGGYSPVTGADAVNMTSFSSWGPADDGRIKPDLVGNGEFLLSTYLAPYLFAAASGTSMAAPNVAGSLLLLQQHHENLNGPNQFLRAATLKALAIHTADEAGEGPGPDYIFGWGLLNTKKAAEVITGGVSHEIVEGTLVNGGTDSYPFTVSSPFTQLRATLVWADPPGTPVAPSLDPPDLMLVNDLDLRVSEGGTAWEPWILDPANPGLPATTGDNFRDNVEQVVADAGAGNYIVEVSHKGTLSGSEQDYALIISETLAAPTGGGLLIDEDFSGGLPQGWSIDTVMGVPWEIAPASVPGDPVLNNQTGGSGPFAFVSNGYINITVTSLRTPVLDLSSSQIAVLRFSSFFQFDLLETINVDVSSDGGSNWSNVWSYQGFNPFPTRYSLDLSGPLAGQVGAMIRFRFDSGGDFQGNLWQIDDIELETTDGGGGTGNVPDPATDPVPVDGATGVSVDADLSWTAGAGADSHDVYFGTDPTPDPSESQGNQAGTTFDPGTLAYDTTYYWRIDEVNADGTTTGTVWSFGTESEPLTPPAPASNPSPGNGATDVGIDADLSWTAGTGADSHDVYFGTTNPPAFQGNQAGTTFDPGALAYDTTYYWRIDEVNVDGTTTGTVWSFGTESEPLTPPAPASTPSPADGATEVGIDADLSWTAGSGADSHDVYFGTTNPPAFQGNQAGTTFDPGTLAYDTTYYWRIDEVNADGTTTGTVWSFGTESEPVTTVTVHLAGLDGVDQPAARGRWSALVTALVHDDIGTPRGGITVDGSWSGGANGGGSCLTGSDGQCTVEKGNLKNNVASVTFTVTALSAAGHSYDPAANTVDVSVTVAPGGDDGGGGGGGGDGERSVTTTPYKVKGVQHVDIAWAGFSSGAVDIFRDTGLIAADLQGNDGSHVDNIGVKGGGSYVYAVCEAGTTTCVSATAAF